MTYTIEDIKRLVPEATGWKSTDTVMDIAERAETLALLLLTTRRQLEIAREELDLIAKQQDYEMMLDPLWAKRIALHAIGAIKQAGEEA